MKSGGRNGRRGADSFSDGRLGNGSRMWISATDHADGGPTRCSLLGVRHLLAPTWAMSHMNFSQ